MIQTTVKKSEYRRMPWANGGGVTDELFVCRDPQTGCMRWRISMADVSVDGPFSHFDGCDRVLVLIAGRGLNLSFNGGIGVELCEVYEQVSFSGDVATYATLHGGPIRDLNVILDRQSLKASVAILQDGDQLVVPPNAAALAVLAREGDIFVGEPSERDIRVASGDLLVAQQPEPGTWRNVGATSIATLLLHRSG